MDDFQYQVRVTGLATDRFPAAGIAAAFAELFCLAPPEAEARLSMLPLVVRGNLSLEQARKYCRVLARRGIECELLVQRPVEEGPATTTGGEGVQAAPSGQGA
ncbi:MAG: hypothetical protein V4729_12330 [Pseudomonadota bacterium]